MQKWRSGALHAAAQELRVPRWGAQDTHASNMLKVVQALYHPTPCAALLPQETVMRYVAPFFPMNSSVGREKLMLWPAQRWRCALPAASMTKAHTGERQIEASVLKVCQII